MEHAIMQNLTQSIPETKKSDNGMKGLWADLILSHLNINPNDVKKYSYAYLVMLVMNKIGIERSSQILKAIADVQKILDKVVNDLSKLEDLLAELAQLRGKGKNGEATESQIDHWLHDKGPDGVSNAEKMKKLWSEVYKKDPNDKHGLSLIQQLHNALNNPFYKQGTGTAFNSTKDLDGPDGPFSQNAWSDGTHSFQDFLDGKWTWDPNTPEGHKMEIEFNKIVWNVYNNSFLHNTDTDKGNTYNDDIGNAKNATETAKQMDNGLSTTESTDMSMYSQNLTSDIQIAQQVIQAAQKEISTIVSHQRAQ